MVRHNRDLPYEALLLSKRLKGEVGPLAHQVEHHTFNVVVAGSSPARLTSKFKRSTVRQRSGV